MELHTTVIEIAGTLRALVKGFTFMFLGQKVNMYSNAAINMY